MNALRRSAPLAALAVTLALQAGAFVLTALMTPASVPAAERPSGGPLSVAALAFALVGALIARRRAGNPIGWMLLGVAALMTLGVTNQYVIDAHYAPASFPAPAVAGLAGNFAWIAALGLLVSLFLCFPDGKLPSPRWRWALCLPVLGFLLGEIGSLTDPAALDVGSVHLANPWAVGPPFLAAVQVAMPLAWLVLLILLAVGVAGQFVRYRRPDPVLRQQLRVVIGAGLFLVATLAFTGVLFTHFLQAPTALVNFVYGLGYLVVPLAIGVSVLRYRLYDLELFISRALVYAALAVFITLVYVALVVWLGSLVQSSQARPNLGLSIVATAVVAVAFQPLRERLQKLANRLVFGRRATPYEVLSRFVDEVASAYGGASPLERMARLLAEGTDAQSAEVWVGGRPAAAHGDEGAVGEERRVPVYHHGEELGALVVRKRRGETLNPREEQLLGDLANQAGLVLRNVGLSQQLLGRLEELRASRQRLVRAQDEERRRLERDLHDGAQQHLVALKIKLGLAGATARDPELADLIRELGDEADAALRTMRELARGIYPPLLAERGLREALEAHSRRLPLPVAVAADGIGRHPQELEAAVYFCVLEALQNVHKHACATRAEVRLWEDAGELRFEVRDDGAGFSSGQTGGSGLTNMRDRLEALSGALCVSSEPGAGTRVEGRLPVRQPLPA